MKEIHRDNLVNVRRNQNGGVDDTNRYLGFSNDVGSQVGTLLFQSGLPSKEGINGLTNEAVIATVLDRLEAQNVGDFKSEYNSAAIECLRAALAALKQRVKDREARGVSGTYIK